MLIFFKTKEKDTLPKFNVSIQIGVENKSTWFNIRMTPVVVFLASKWAFPPFLGRH